MNECHRHGQSEASITCSRKFCQSRREFRKPPRAALALEPHGFPSTQHGMPSLLNFGALTERTGHGVDTLVLGLD